MCLLAVQQDEHPVELEEESDTLSEQSSPQLVGEALAYPSPPPESDGERVNSPTAGGGLGCVVVDVVIPKPQVLICSHLFFIISLYHFFILKQ